MHNRKTIYMYMFSTADCVWFRCRPEFDAIPRPRTDPPATESKPLPLRTPRGTDFRAQPIQICAVSFA